MIGNFARFGQWRLRKVLEIGVGVGVDHLEFAKNEVDLVGIDASNTSIRVTQARFQDLALRPSLIRCDAEYLPFRNEVFDMTYCWGVIHHLVSPENSISEIYRVLKQRGKVRAMIYNRVSLYGLWLCCLYGLPHGSFNLSDTLARFLESPDTKAFTKAEVTLLFHGFETKVRPELTGADLPFLYGFERIRSIACRILNKLGFFLLIEGTKV